MKKSIGLTANISEYRPNLPQTRHLNYFMGTNPVYMAGGGDVKAGIPNYPDVNVTRGFLPAALGFDNGGDVEQKKSWLGALITVIADMVDGDENDDSVIKVAEKILENEPEKAEVIIKQGVENGIIQDDGVFKIDKSKLTDEQKTWEPHWKEADEIPSDYPGKGLTTTEDEAYGQTIDTSTPIDTAKISDAQDLISAPKAPISDVQDLISAPKSGGITGIPQEVFDKEEEIKGLETPRKVGDPLDLNGDGVVDWKDLALAAKQGAWDIWGKIQKYIKGFTEGDQEEQPKETEISDKQDLISVPKAPEKIVTKAPEISDKQDLISVPKGGITSIDKGYPGEKFTTTEEATLGQNEQAIFKKTADIAKGGGIGDTEKKKDVPAWALPLMSAGFAMMASKSPYFMQALGEGGQKGIETYAAQETGKEEKLDKKSERELRKAQAKALENQRGSIQLVGGKYFYKDGSPYMVREGQNLVHATKTYTRAEIIEKLSTNIEFQTLFTKTNKTKEDIDKIESIIAATTKIFNSGAGGSTIDNETALEDKGPGIFEKGWKYGKGFFGLEDGGIVSLRR